MIRLKPPGPDLKDNVIKQESKPPGTITAKTYREEYLSKTRKKGKYHNVRQEYNGVIYDSKLEAKYAQELDFRIDAGQVVKWERQVKLELKVYGNHVTNYFIDFKVYNADGTIEYVECKGMKLPLWIMKWQLLLALSGTNDDPLEPGAELKVVRA